MIVRETSTVSSVRTSILNGFDDPSIGPEEWNRLLPRGDTNTVFQTWHWQRAWWESMGAGTLLLIAAARDGEVVGLGPLYADEGVVFFLGCGEADYLDFIGDVSAPGVLEAVLTSARDCVPGFLGFKFHSLLDRSRTRQRLREAADQLGLEYFIEEVWTAVDVDLAGQLENVRTATNRSMKKREDFFRERGSFVVRQFRDSEEIRSQLGEYYAQHLARWSKSCKPSSFARPKHRALLERFLALASGTGWVRFLRLDWQEKPLAFEFAWYYDATHYSAPKCFAVELARHCPGHVLLRQSLLAALDQGLTTYDLGAGDQDYKFRLPVRVKDLFTVGLY